MSMGIEAVLKASLVMAAGLALMPLLQRSSAALRHWVLALAIAVAALQPVLGAVVPRLAIPAAVGPAILPARPGAALASPTAEALADVDSQWAVAVTAPADAIPFDPMRLVPVVWAAGVVLRLAWLGVGFRRLRRLRRNARAAGARWARHEAGVRHTLGLRRRTSLLITQHDAVLVTYGLIRPIILLPRDADAWSDERIRLVMAHELAHVARGDWFVHVVAELCRAVYWFNPLFWIACARLRREGEQAADDIVLNLGADRTAYADHLVNLARAFSVRARTWLPAPAVVRPSTLERRVSAMLNPAVNRRPVRVHARLVLALVISCAAASLAAVTQPLGIVGGTLTDPSGRVLQNTSVRLSATGADTVLEAQSGPDGRFQFPAVPSGEYLISARQPGLSSGRQRITVPAGEAIELALMLQVESLQESISVTAANARTAPRETTSPRAYTPKPCTPSEVGGRIVPPLKLRDVRPRYPRALVEAGVSGTVLLQARVGPDGSVTAVEPLSSPHVELEEAAIDAVSQWAFSPTLLNCDPVEVRMFVTVSFRTEP